MSDVEVHLDWEGTTSQIGILRRHSGRGKETVTFEYVQEWIENKSSFSIEPALPVGAGTFAPSHGREIFGTIGDSAPDTWGRQLMRRRERRAAEREGRAIRTLFETDYLLGVSDEARLGAIRLRHAGDDIFQAPQERGVPGLIALGDLLQASERVLRGEETDEDLQMIFAPGSSLGGARPKASVLDQHGNLSIAKFPKEADEYCLERWESIALQLAGMAGLNVSQNELVVANDKPVLLSMRFDRKDDHRIPFLSAMSMTEHKDGEHGSYLEMVDGITAYGATATSDRSELFRRMVFNVLISNVDDHLRNHGFLWLGSNGWSLSPVYDVNPTPQDMKPRILTTSIDYDDGTCSIDLDRSVAEQFGMKQKEADEIIGNVAVICRTWRDVAHLKQAPKAEINRMASAFEHEDLEKALNYA